MISKSFKLWLSILFGLVLMIPVLSVKAAVKGKKTPTGSGVILSAGQVSAPKGTPTRAIQEIENKMDAYKTGVNLTAADRSHNSQLKRQILNSAFDLRELCRLALDRHWNQISSGERSNFVNLMTRLLETKAIFAKEQSKTQGQKYRVNYKGDQYFSRRTKAKTLTVVIVPSKNVNVDIEYKLNKKAKEWKIFDVIVDEASLVENYRYQFNNIITKHGYSELVRRMRKKLNELKSNQS